MQDRELNWEGCFNARDLGGLRTAGGQTIRSGALVRSDSLDRLAVAGWSALHAHGIRTIIDLRNDDEIGTESVMRPAAITTVHISLDDAADTEFWNECWTHDLDGSPLYYELFWSESHNAALGVSVVRAWRRAEPEDQRSR